MPHAAMFGGESLNPHAAGVVGKKLGRDTSSVPKEADLPPSNLVGPAGLNGPLP